MINHELVATMAASTGMTREAVLEAFRDSLRTDMAQLRTLAAADAHGAVAAQAHRISGACEMLGATAATQACRELEAAVRAGPAGTAPALARLEQEVQRLDAYLGALDGR